jgi:DNA-binding transcriptional LysR family regulator
MPLSLKAMRYFTTALRHGNIANAALELNIAASAVSTAIDQVETEFDLTLITRQRSKGISANASGRSIVQKFDTLLDDYKSVMAQGADLKQSLSGTLNIGYYAPIAPAFLPKILSTFVPENTDITLQLEECDNDTAQAGLLNGKYDAILFVSQDVRPAITYDELIQAPSYCLMAKSHPLAKQTQISMAQIADEPLVVLNRPVASSYYQRILNAQTRPPKIAAYANSTEMVRSLVGAGYGCAILNMLPLTDHTYANDPVIGIPISDPLPPLTLSIGYDKTRPRNLVQHFVNACHAHFATAGATQCVVTNYQ